MKPTVCPFLAIKEDPNTALDFPSQGNYCHNARPVAQVRGSYQEVFCLSSNHIHCPLYLAATPQPMPAHIAVPVGGMNVKRALILAGIPVLVAGAAALAYAWNSGSARLAGMGAIPDTGAGSRKPGGWSLLVGTSTPYAPTTNTPLPPTPQVKCPMPENWALYLVKPTDTLFRLSVVYGVSMEELQRVNCMGEETSLTPGTTIYVPVQPTSTPNPSSTAAQPAPTNTYGYIPPEPTIVPVGQREEQPRPTAVPPTAAPVMPPPTSPPPPPTNPPPQEQPTSPPPAEKKPKPSKPTAKPKPTKKPKPETKATKPTKKPKDNKGSSGDQTKDKPAKGKSGGKGKG